jgi:hypothetical protein
MIPYTADLIKQPTVAQLVKKFAPLWNQKNDYREILSSSPQ